MAIIVIFSAVTKKKKKNHHHRLPPGPHFEKPWIRLKCLNSSILWALFYLVYFIHSKQSQICLKC